MDAGILGKAFFDAMDPNDDKGVKQILGSLAESGNLEALQFIWENKLLSSQRFENPAIAYMILPLVGYVEEDKLSHAETLIDDWISLGSANTIEKITNELKSCVHSGTIWELTRRAVVKLSKSAEIASLVTALLHDEDRVDRISAIINAAADAGAVEPARAAIVQVIDETGNAYFHRAIKSIRDLGLPDETFTPAAAQVVAKVIAIAPKLQELDKWGQINQIKTWAESLRCVQPDTQQWEEVSAAWFKVPEIFSVMVSEKNLASEAESLLTSIARAGVDVCALTAQLPAQKTAVPLVHAAASADNLSIVQTLLSLGADPSLKVRVKGKMTSALDLAPENGQCSPLMRAWEARTAVATVVAQTRARTPS